MITQIQIFGERCSGTNFLEQLIKKNYDIKVTSDFGWKHWYIDFTKLSNNNTDNTLFIVIVRNPYDQLRSLSLQPHHAPFHFEIGLSNFLRKKWLSYDLESTTNWLTPDSWWLALPEYLIESEKNVCVLRNKKNKNFLGLQNKVKNFLLINYENITKLIFLEIFGIKRISIDWISIDSYKGEGNEKYIAKEYPEFEIEDINFINETLDWEIENKLGYEIIN